MRIAAFAIVAFVVTATVASAAGVTSYIDHRVTAIPASVLLSADPHQLVDPRRAIISRTYGLYRRPLFFFWAFSQIVAFFWLWNSGNAARLRDALKRVIPVKFWLRFAYGAALALVATLAALPASLGLFRVAIVFDQLNEPLGAWLRDGAVRTTIDALAVGLVVACILTLVDLTRQWWIYGIGIVFFISIGYSALAPILVSPLFDDSLRPLPPDSAAAARIAAVAHRAGADNVRVDVRHASVRTLVADGEVEGVGSTARVVLDDTLLTNATPGEVAFAYARELVKFRNRADFRQALLGTFLFVLCIAVGVLLSDRVGFRRDDDPLARLALVGAMLGLAALVAYPLYNAYSRRVETRADDAAFALTADREAAERYYLRFSEEHFLPVCPPAPIRWYFYDRNPLGTRIARVRGEPDPCP